MQIYRYKKLGIGVRKNQIMHFFAYLDKQVNLKTKLNTFSAKFKSDVKNQQCHILEAKVLKTLTITIHCNCDIYINFHLTVEKYNNSYQKHL